MRINNKNNVIKKNSIKNEIEQGFILNLSTIRCCNRNIITRNFYYFNSIYRCYDNKLPHFLY
jgi:hypothetical protein